jgi:peptidoglycan/LPS O-acetylase OafA/YrhL
VLISNGERDLFEELDAATFDGGVILSDDSMLGYLATVYGPLLSLLGLGLICGGYFLRDNVSAPNVLAVGVGCCAVASASSKAASPVILLAPAAIGRASYEIYLLHPVILFLAAPVLRGKSMLGGWLLVCCDHERGRLRRSPGRF